MRGTIPIAELDPTPWRSFRHDGEGETTMNTARFAGHGGVMTTTSLHATDESLMRNGH
jgi:hypothetical protein